MVWTQAAAEVDLIVDALRSYDWQASEERVRALCAAILRTSDKFPDDQSRRLLRELRAKRRFSLMEIAAGALIPSGVRSPQVRRQFAQSLIDQGRYAAAEFVLQSILSEQPGSVVERTEARGLLGRLYKQLYVNPGNSLPRGHAGFLQRAIEEYSEAYGQQPGVNYWPGINVCALLARAARDGVAVPGYASPESIAQQIGDALRERAEAAVDRIPAFEVATALEVLVALGRMEDALGKANEYVRCGDADAFEIGGTLRQLEEVWQLDPASGPAGKLLILLRAMMLRQQGSDVHIPVEQAAAQLATASEMASDPALEAVLGIDRFQTLGWYKLGLERCASVARIETQTGTGFGTGWLVRGEDFNPKWKGTLLLTNKHVLSPPVNGERFLDSELPGNAVANLQALGLKLPVEAKEIWTSPDTDLDATFVRLKRLPRSVKPLELHPDAVTMSKPPDRVYLMGHPQGRDLEFSLQDNLMIDCSERLIQYRAPTEPGSSGSPVFEARNWRVIALHHAGSKEMRKLTGRGRHEANEGISMRALRAATARA